MGVLLVLVVLAAPLAAADSDVHARYVLDAMLRYSPEAASGLGLEQYDAQVSDLSDASRRDAQAAGRRVLQELRKRLRKEQDPRTRQDLEILIDSTAETLREQELNDRYILPYLNVARTVFGGVRGLLDDQVAESRRPAALTRLRRYAGMEPGTRPIAETARQRLAAAMKNAKLAGPYRKSVEQDLAQAGFFLDGLGQLFAKYKIAGYEEPLQTLRRQVDEYHAFVRDSVLPRARETHVLPAPVYQHALRHYGVDIPAPELTRMAREAFAALQVRAGDVAARVAEVRGWRSRDYRDVIRQLKKEQLDNDTILDHYRQRLAEIEAIVRREDLVTLPERPARIRLATPAESAGQPAPHMRPPRLIGNTGESGEFVLPMRIPDASGQTEGYDDFTFAAASWTLSVHELRPGHEMQFAALIENGVSLTRAIFAFNSTNVEGWGLYSEAIMQPFMPLEGQLISLQHRMMRAARAFLDPGLQAGQVTPEEAGRILREDVVLSPAMARQEVDRYTFRSPGQATSYFYGYTRLMELRKDVEARLGGRFEAKRFHDFILAQGLLPPALLRKAVSAEFLR
ncbi:MAG: DUF885 domain-containing protein [Bryobacterales bacterium]|nr:DUF885 domain-containing protein [Bryobacterales bacterium]